MPLRQEAAVFRNKRTFPVSRGDFPHPPSGFENGNACADFSFLNDLSQTVGAIWRIFMFLAKLSKVGVRWFAMQKDTHEDKTFHFRCSNGNLFEDINLHLGVELNDIKIWICYLHCFAGQSDLFMRIELFVDNFCFS